jgi:hypothetical protein
MSAELVTKIKDLEHWSTFKEANEKKLLGNYMLSVIFSMMMGSN